MDNENNKNIFLYLIISILLIVSIAAISALVLLTKRQNKIITTINNGSALNTSSSNNQVSKKPINSIGLKELSEVEKKELLTEAQSFCAEEKDNCKSEDQDCINYAESKNCLDSVYNEKAASSTDPFICQLISSNSNKQLCLDITYTKLAFKEKNPEACAKISQDSQRISCLNEVNYSLAMDNKKNGEKYCTQISKKTMKEICLKRIKE